MAKSDKNDKRSKRGTDMREHGGVEKKSSGHNRRNGVVSVSELALPVLEPILSRRAGMRMDLIAGWPAIVGEDHARYTLPEKIKWPRRAHEDDPFAPGTLVVACDGARAVLFQHETGWIKERVNGFFGFEAIDRVKLLQKPVAGRSDDQLARMTVSLDSGEEKRLEQMLDSVTDPELRKRLEKLGKGIIAKARKER